jgi:hypothetical protein
MSCACVILKVASNGSHELIALQVLRSSGVDAILNPGASVTPETDVSAVHDALEALTAIACASEEGRLVCLQSGAIAAAATALQVGTFHQHWVKFKLARACT